MTKGHTIFTLVNPYPEQYAGLVLQWLQEHGEETLDDAAPQNLEQLVAKGKADKAAGGQFYGVMIEGELPVGCIWFEHAGLGTYLGHLAFSHNHLSPTQRAEATRLAVQDLFKWGAHKIIWSILAKNKIFQNFLAKRLHATTEGLLRKQAQCKGEWVDIVFMASFPQEIME